MYGLAVFLTYLLKLSFILEVTFSALWFCVTSVSFGEQVGCSFLLLFVVCVSHVCIPTVLLLLCIFFSCVHFDTCFKNINAPLVTRLSSPRHTCLLASSLSGHHHIIWHTHFARLGMSLREISFDAMASRALARPHAADFRYMASAVASVSP